MRLIFPDIKNIPPDRLWLVFLRCGVSALALAHFAAIQFDFNNIFSFNSFVPPDIEDAFKDPLLPSVYSLYHFTSHLAGISYDTVLLTIRILYPLSLLMLLTGCLTRFSALMSLLLQLVILNSMDLYTYGVDVFTTIGLFYCLIFPTGNDLSLDRYFFKAGRKSIYNNLFLWIFRAHVCIVYFFSGFEKLLGYNWRNGESIWKMVHGYNTLPFIDLDFLSNTPLFFISGWLTIVLEMLYPIFINISKTRRLWLWSVIGFHIAIAFFMGLYFFSCIMIILNLAAWYVPFMKTEADAQKVLLPQD
jgi:hypothetical protein